MKIIYCKPFGLGNAICAIPALRALRTLYGSSAQIDVLIGSGPDDAGALFVFNAMKNKTSEIDNIWVDTVPQTTPIYDIAIQAMPYDGRWRNDVHYFANEDLDGLPRPDPTTMGFGSWKKHEIEYQMDTVRKLGYIGPTPVTYFGFGEFKKENLVYLGMGYKKDANGFWAQKHWTNEKYAELISLLMSAHPEIQLITSGDILDLKMTINPIKKLVGASLEVLPSTDLRSACQLIGRCKTYIGNDTGMAHVAYSASCNSVVVFKMDNAWTKSGPVGTGRHEILKGHDRDVTAEEFLEAFERVHYGKN